MVQLGVFHIFISEKVVTKILIQASILLMFIIGVFCFLIFPNELLNLRVQNDKFSRISLR